MNRRNYCQCSTVTIFWITACAACFCGGWILPQPIQSGEDETAAKNSGSISTNCFSYSNSPNTLIEGIVLRTENDLAVISIGSDDGLKIGAKVEFARNGVVIGTGTVVKPEFNMAACQCIGESLPIPGDLARLNPKTVANE